MPTMTITCLNCKQQKTIKNYGNQYAGKYCSCKCQRLYEWEHVTKPRIERGEATSNSAPTLKRYLIETVGEKCSECPTTGAWNGKPLTLQLDHIDGDSENNWPNNIRLLCPNCHTQTSNYGAKNTRKTNSKRVQYYRTLYN